MGSIITLESVGETIERTITKHMEEEGTHPAGMVDTRLTQDVYLDLSVITCRCHACERVWDLSIPNTAARRSWDFVVNQISDWMKSVSSTLCYKLQQRCELSEWITEVVAAADPDGITYGRLLQMATEEHLCAPNDVDVVLSQLGFVTRWHKSMINAVDALDQVPMVETYLLKDGTFVHGGPRIILPHNHPMKGVS
jgi:hypothetical protein